MRNVSKNHRLCEGKNNEYNLFSCSCSTYLHLFSKIRKCDNSVRTKASSICNSLYCLQTHSVSSICRLWIMAEKQSSFARDSMFLFKYKEQCLNSPGIVATQLLLEEGIILHVRIYCMCVRVCIGVQCTTYSMFHSENVYLNFTWKHQPGKQCGEFNSPKLFNVSVYGDVYNVK